MKYKIMYAVLGLVITDIGNGRIRTGPNFIRSVHNTREEAFAARTEENDSVESFITKEEE